MNIINEQNYAKTNGGFIITTDKNPVYANKESRTIRVNTEITGDIAGSVVDAITDINAEYEENLKNKKIIERQLRTKGLKPEDKINLKNRLIAVKMELVEKPIIIYLHTQGGSVPHAFQIVEAMKQSKIPVHVYAVGAVYSAGLLILLNANKRIGSEYTEYLIHDMSLSIGGKLNHITNVHDSAMKFRNVLTDLFLTKTKLTKEFINDMYDRQIDYTFIGKEALKLGFVDEVK